MRTRRQILAAIEGLLDAERDEQEEALAAMTDEALRDQLAALAERLAELERSEETGDLPPGHVSPGGDPNSPFADMPDAELLAEIEKLQHERRRREGWVPHPIYGGLIPPTEARKLERYYGDAELVEPPRLQPALEPHPLDLEEDVREPEEPEEQLTPKERARRERERREAAQHEQMAELIERTHRRLDRQAEKDWEREQRFEDEPISGEIVWHEHGDPTKE